MKVHDALQSRPSPTFAPLPAGWWGTVSKHSRICIFSAWLDVTMELVLSDPNEAGQAAWFPLPAQRMIAITVAGVFPRRGVLGLFGRLII